MKICKCCRYSENNWNGSRYYCRLTIESNWSWVLGKAVESLRLCELVNNDGDCKKFEPKWRIRDIFTKKFWRKSNATTKS